RLPEARHPDGHVLQAVPAADAQEARVEHARGDGPRQRLRTRDGGLARALDRSGQDPRAGAEVQGLPAPDREPDDGNENADHDQVDDPDPDEGQNPDVPGGLPAEVRAKTVLSDAPFFAV